jgi:hypothetical protein
MRINPTHNTASSRQTSIAANCNSMNWLKFAPRVILQAPSQITLSRSIGRAMRLLTKGIVAFAIMTLQAAVVFASDQTGDPFVAQTLDSRQTLPSDGLNADNRSRAVNESSLASSRPSTQRRNPILRRRPGSFRNGTSRPGIGLHVGFRFMAIKNPDLGVPVACRGSWGRRADPVECGPRHQSPGTLRARQGLSN